MDKEIINKLVKRGIHVKSDINYVDIHHNESVTVNITSKQDRTMDLTLDEQAIRIYPDSESHQLAYKYGYKIALRTIKGEIQQCVINDNQFVILHILKFIDKKLNIV